MVLTDPNSIITASGALSFVSASVLSLALIPFAYRIGAVDGGVGERRMHKDKKARIGGVAIYLAAALLGTLFARGEELYAFLIGGGIIILGGLADDIYTLSPWQKLLYQAFAALSVLPYTKCGFFGVVSAVALTNAYNLIDGLDGLAAGCAASALIALFFIGDEMSIFTLILIGATLGFLAQNLYPARLFLGDSGAMLLGFSLSVLAPRDVAFSASHLVFFLPVFDVAFAIMRRTLSGRDPFSPDRGHLHHRLVDSGLSHFAASAILTLISFGFCAAAVLIDEVGITLISLISLFLLIFSFLSVILITVKKNSEESDEKS